jgi:hypothetical protein
MPAEFVRLTEEDMQKALGEHVYAAVRFIYPPGGEGVVAEMWVADTHVDIDAAVLSMRFKPGKIDIHRKED